MSGDVGIIKEHNTIKGLILKTLLADEHLLYIEPKTSPCNVAGYSSNEHHLFFGKQAEEAEDIIGTFAQSIRRLGFYTTGTMKDF